MSQPEQRPEDRTTRDAKGPEAAEADIEAAEDDVEGHAYTGALQDKNQQP